MEQIEKYADCVGIFYSYGIHREIREHESRIPLLRHLWRNCPEVPSRRRSADELPVLQSTKKKRNLYIQHNQPGNSIIQHQ